MRDASRRPAHREAGSSSGPDVICARRDYPDGWTVGPHCHDRAQLVYALSGVMEIRAEDRLWIVPPQRALWMPARTAHALRARGAVALRTLYMAERVVPDGWPHEAASVPVTALLRELILRATKVPDRHGETARRGRLMGVLLDEMADLPRDRLCLTMPTDPRLARICAFVLAHPADRQGMDALALRAGASTRTLARLADEAFGVPFAVWRQHARILAALPLLAAGRSITVTALTVGYETPSAFASMFRRVMGMSPRDYVATIRAG